MAHPPTDTVLTTAAARELAEDIFVLGFPLLLVDAVRGSHPIATTRFHRLSSGGGVLARALGTDDPCTVQSSLVADLAAGPAVLRLPDLQGRYFSLTLFDTAGEPFASLGSRTHDDDGRDLAVAGPRWRGEIADGLVAYRAPSDGVWAVSRIVGHSPADLPEVAMLAARQCLVPLRRLADEARDPSASLQSVEAPSLQQIADLAPDVLFHRLQQLVERAPAAARARSGAAISARLAKVTRAAAETGAWADDLSRAFSHGFADAAASIHIAAEARHGCSSSGWQASARSSGDAAGSLERAACALAALGAPAPEDILELRCAADESGRLLGGAERYRIHFNPGATPPARAAWRLSVAADEGVAVAMIGDHSDLRFNRDGSLDLLIQAAAPSGQALNWLPAPAGPFRLSVRLYWPEEAALSGGWRMAPVERLGSRFARRSRSRPPSTEPPPPPAIGARNIAAPLSFLRISP